MKKQLILEAYNKLESARNLIGRLKRSMLAHPDCTNGSEFDDYTSIAQQIEDELTCFLNEFHDNVNGYVDKTVSNDDVCDNFKVTKECPYWD